MNENAEISAAPSAMKIARRTSAARIPNVEHPLLVLGAARRTST